MYIVHTHINTLKQIYLYLYIYILTTNTHTRMQSYIEHTTASTKLNAKLVANQGQAEIYQVISQSINQSASQPANH